MLDVEKIKSGYSFFYKNPNIVYLDNAATSLTPDIVTREIVRYYKEYNANTSRGVYRLSQKATEEYEKAREKIAKFIGVDSAEEVVFTCGTTASINFLANGLLDILGDGNIVTSPAEHHSNFVPWQILASNNDNFRLVELDSESNSWISGNLRDKIDKNTKILTVCHVSNVLGNINPVKDIISMAKSINPDIITIVDAAQSISHKRIDVKDLGCDFLAFSGHKMFGPTGIGVLWGKKEVFSKLKPTFYGGEMINKVSANKSTFADLPHRFEAGTSNIAGAIGLGHAVDYLLQFEDGEVESYLSYLTAYAIEEINRNFGSDIKIYGTKNLSERGPLFSFSYLDYHPHDIATILDNYSSVCVRAGTHCAMPLHNDILGVSATTRVSLQIYNSREDIDKFISGLKEVKRVLKK